MHLTFIGKHRSERRIENPHYLDALTSQAR